ncbi:MAG: aspartyl/asparaginyl beta-hydroxylase domain-containing protein [Gemmata sp.]
MKTRVRWVGWRGPRVPSARLLKRAAKRVVLVAAAVYFLPYLAAAYFLIGLIDFARNTGKNFASFDRYFFGNGAFTWLLAPVNLFFDLLTFPYRNRKIYALTDLPPAYQAELSAIFDAAHRNDLVGRLREKLGDTKRAMIFFKWYGKNVGTSVPMPEYHAPMRFVRTIGVSVFNSRQSTGRHYGPLRLTLRVLYNVNDTVSPDVFIEVGDRVHRWRDGKLFIFDDTLQHQSCNQSDEPRYCLFIDILRPSYVPRVLDAVLGCVRFGLSRFNRVFYKHWTMLK